MINSKHPLLPRFLGAGAIAALAGCGDYVCLEDGAQLSGEVAPITPNADLSAETAVRSYALSGIFGEHAVEEVTADGVWRRFDYDGFTASTEGNAALGEYVSGLSTVDPENLETPEERLAYWLNVYNAWVLYAVAGNYADDPDYDVESDGWLVFSTPFIQVGEYRLTPNDVEHGILRGWDGQVYADDATEAQAAVWTEGVWGGGPPDARIHAGLNCASTSCPNLGPGAFQGDRIYDQLDFLATEFLDNSAKGAGPDGISTLFNWFAEDFEGSHGSVESFVATYRTNGTEGVNLGRYLDYDWGLNAAPEASSGAPCGF